MKKLFLTLAALTSFVGVAQAQLNARSKVMFGVKAGGTAASFKGEGASAYERSIYGFHAGLAWKVATTKVFSVHPELLFSMRGSKNIQTSPNATTKLSYIDVPVTVRASMKSGAFLEIGPQLGVLLSAKSELDGVKTDVKEFFNTVDLGYVIGAGVQPKRGGLGGGVRYNAGFTYARQEGLNNGVLIQPDVRNSIFQLYVAYMFH